MEGGQRKVEEKGRERKRRNESHKDRDKGNYGRRKERKTEELKTEKHNEVRREKGKEME